MQSQITWPKEQLSIIYRFNDILSLLEVLMHTYNNKYDYDINSINVFDRWNINIDNDL